MRRASRLGLAGLAVVGLGWVAAGTLRARQIPGANDFRGSGPVNTMFVEAPPRTVAWTRTWLQLQKVVPLEYPDGIKLGDLLKRVREETRAPEFGFPRGVPIYIEPNALADVDATLDSTVTIDLDSVPLAKALKLALHQRFLWLELRDDGLIVIDSPHTDGEGANRVDHESANWESFERLGDEIKELRAEVRALREALRPHLIEAPNSPGAPVAPAPATGGGFR